MFEICEKLYTQHGYVKWADVGRALDVSRQAIQLRLRAAQSRGDLDDATYERWSSMTARAAATREREKAQRERTKAKRRLEVRVALSPENAEWLRLECVLRQATSADIVNGLINKARTLN